LRFNRARHLRHVQRDTERVHRLAPVIDTERARLRAVRHERREQIGNLHGATMLTLKALHVVPLAFGPQRDSEADIGAMRRARRHPQAPAVGFDD
jgi:hypothetical protein